MGAVSAVATTSSLARDLRELGVDHGQSVLLHASMRSLGTVDGGPAAVVAAFREALGPRGTLVVPAMTMDNSDTSREHLRRVQGMTRREQWHYRRRMPAFDPLTTPGTGMGVIAEHVRTSPGAVRSAHPQSSFAAVGGRASLFMGRHKPGCHLGEDSPLAALYEADAKICLLGVGYDACSAFHLAEYRYTAHPPRRRYGCVVKRNGRAEWRHYRDVILDDGEFGQLGADLEVMCSHIGKGQVGAAAATLIPIREAVDFATTWLAEHRMRHS